MRWSGARPRPLPEDATPPPQEMQGEEKRTALRALLRKKRNCLTGSDQQNNIEVKPAYAGASLQMVADASLQRVGLENVEASGNVCVSDPLAGEADAPT